MIQFAKLIIILLISKYLYKNNVKKKNKTIYYE